TDAVVVRIRYGVHLEHAHNEGEAVAADNLEVVEIESRIWDGPAHHARRARVKLLVVAVGAAVGHDGRQRRASATGAASTLLVVGPPRRDIPQRDGSQASDVDANFHGGRAREHVDRAVLATLGTLDV